MVSPVQKVEQAIVAKLPPPAFADIAKASNDLINKDFYHNAAAALEVKLKAPNGVNFTVKGVSAHDGPLSSSLEGKKSLSNGITPVYYSLAVPFLANQYFSSTIFHLTEPPGDGRSMNTVNLRLIRGRTGISITQSWNTANALQTKVELNDTLASGLKAEVLSNFNPAAGNKGQKLNLHFKQSIFHGRFFGDFHPSGSVSAVADAVLSHEGFVVGGEVGYDVQKAAITKYSAAVGYTTFSYNAAITATNALQLFAASYYQRVNSAVEAGAKATWDAKQGSNVGLELAAKYKIDTVSFAKV
ncbi:hypothetical protein P154DRAFT_519015 [Amniculicola lignicola CBS 123094]|uniref:Mitochondrial porin-like protein n=1 Tax=Amniculicola lignicola CBS 123094 TaxID=1392246 RepID=A0A6A5WSX4_9PLEO|nr:hypothetical protein P154DRAFT_519015 [Amniculicola lignicola CBS 123094]